LNGDRKRRVFISTEVLAMTNAGKKYSTVLELIPWCALVPPLFRVRPSMCTPVTPAVPYLLLDLQDVQWAMGNSRGARKLARTPHVNKKKKKIFNKFGYGVIQQIMYCASNT
jgi:hypothetical protein